MTPTTSMVTSRVTLMRLSSSYIERIYFVSETGAKWKVWDNEQCTCWVVHHFSMLSLWRPFTPQSGLPSLVTSFYLTQLANASQKLVDQLVSVTVGGCDLLSQFWENSRTHSSRSSPFFFTLMYSPPQTEVSIDKTSDLVHHTPGAWPARDKVFDTEIEMINQLIGNKNQFGNEF